MASVLVDSAGMARRRKKSDRDRHKFPQLNVRLHPDLRRQLEVLTQRNLSDLSEEVRAAVIRHLRDHGLWPPPSPER